MYNRVQAEIDAKAKAQHDALQQAVEASTFEAMDYDLEEDKKDLIKYGSELLQKKNTWSFYLDVQNVNVNQWELCNFFATPVRVLLLTWHLNAAP